MENDTTLLPMIFQHVRELAESHTAPTEKQRFKLLTPFPPVFNDFPDFQQDQLEFGDPQNDPVAAESDTNHAFNFFRNTDSLYYDYSYGIKQEEPTLSKICKEFYENAVFANTDDTNFVATFAEKKDAFFRKYERFTTGDLGQNSFVYTSYSPIRWDTNKVVLQAEEIQRIKAKTVAVYANPELSSDYVNSLISQIFGSSFSTIKYEFGVFDVVRQWIDPSLFESRNWKFSSANKVLYGANDPIFESGDVQLCYAQKFYVIRNYSGTSAAPTTNPPNQIVLPPPASNSEVLPANSVNHRVAAPEIRDHRTPNGGGAPVIRDHRRTAMRNAFLSQRVAGFGPFSIGRRNPPPPTISVGPFSIGRQNSRPSAPTSSAGASTSNRPGFVFVQATATVPGHWERERANQPAPVATPAPNPQVVDNQRYKLAAILCRVIPRKPATAQPI